MNEFKNVIIHGSREWSDNNHPTPLSCDGVGRLRSISQPVVNISTNFAENFVDYKPYNTKATLANFGARTVSWDGDAEENLFCKGIVFPVYVTSITGAPSIEVIIQGESGGGFYEIFRSSPITTVGISFLQIYPGITDVAGERLSIALPRDYRVRVEHANGDSISYGISGTLLI